MSLSRRQLLASRYAKEIRASEVREILDDIVHDDKRAGEVIAHLRVMLRKGEVEHERFRIQEPIREVLGLIGGEIDAQGIAVQEELNPDLPPVEAGRVETLQAIMNLLVNAVHALSEVPLDERKIHIRAERQGPDAALVTIEDSGPGIAPDELSRVFEPFFTTKAGGAGDGACHLPAHRGGPGRANLRRERWRGREVLLHPAAGQLGVAA